MLISSEKVLEARVNEIRSFRYISAAVGNFGQLVIMSRTSACLFYTILFAFQYYEFFPISKLYYVVTKNLCQQSR